MARTPNKSRKGVPSDVAAAPGTPLLSLPRGVGGGFGVVVGVGRVVLSTLPCRLLGGGGADGRKSLEMRELHEFLTKFKKKNCVIHYFLRRI